MARAKIGTHSNIKWKKAKVIHKDFFFNKNDIIALLKQPGAKGVTLKKAIINGLPFLVMVAIKAPKKSGSSILLNTSEYEIAFPCSPIRDNQGNKEFELKDLILVPNQ